MVDIELREITDDNRDAVCALRVHAEQDVFVASVEQSLSDADNHPEAHPWFRGVYADGEPVAFVMASWNVPPGRPGIIGPYFLWRLLVDADQQGRGIGWAVLTELVALIKADGGTELLTSYQPGDGEPWPFYRKFGFEPTGELDDTEVVLRLDLTRK